MKKYIAIGYQYQRLVAIIAVLVIICAIAFGTLVPITTAKADTKYSDVLTDLKTDASFNISQWEKRENYYSLQLITIAEGKNDELFVYVYQPYGYARTYYANYIRLSETIDKDIAPRDYRLTYINHSSVFYKYKVEDFTITKEPVRYYAVIQLLRPFMSEVDTQADYDNTINAVPFGVSKQYRFSTENGVNTVSCIDIETVLITEKFVGFVRYIDDPFFMIGTACDSHFVAFSCDHEIDDLLEADVEYFTQKVTLEKEHWFFDYILGGYTTVYRPTDPESQPPTVVTLTDDQYGTFDAKGMFTGRQHYEWKRITSTADFLANIEQTSIYEAGFWSVSTETRLTEEGRNAIAGKQWVLQFVETPYQNASMVGSTTVSYERTNICNVTILRLMFRHNGTVYNLGVVDNMQTGSDKPVTETTFDIEINTESGWWKALIAILLLIVLLIVLWPAVPYIAKFVLWLVSLPFKAVDGAVKACKKREPKSPNEKGLAKIERQQARERRRIERQAKRVNVEKLKNDIWSGKRESVRLTKAEEYALNHDPEWKQAEADAWAAMGYFDDGDSDL